MLENKLKNFSKMFCLRLSNLQLFYLYTLITSFIVEQ